MDRCLQPPESPVATSHGVLPEDEFDALARQQQATWSSGDFAVIGTTLQIVGESLAEAADVRAGERVLDVAAGNGNATLAAARRFAQVVSTDCVPALLDKGARRAEAEGLQVSFRIADARALPFADGRFDVVMSTFGAMPTPDPAQPAREMLRVLRPGGRVAIANWTPHSFIGQLFGVIGRYRPPPDGLKSPALWGTESHIAELFGAQSRQIRAERKHFKFRYRSAAHWIQVFRDCYGPVRMAFAALDDVQGRRLEGEVADLLQRMNVGSEHALVVPSEYLEVVVFKR